MRVTIHLLWLFAYNSLLVRLSGSENVTCLITDHTDTLFCEIDPDKEQHCFIHCDRHITNKVTCVLGCWVTYGSVLCTNTTALDQYQLCCTTPYCNNLTTIPHPSSFSPSPSSTPGGTNDKDTSDNVHYHIIIAVCVVVVVLVVAIIIGSVAVVWIRKKKCKQNNEPFLPSFRWRRLL